MALPSQQYLTEAAYLAFEDDSDFKHEYANGQVVTMTGASWAHNIISVNTSTSLNVQLAQKDCRVTAGDMRVKVLAKESYRYPDVMVICGEPEFVQERQDTISNPTVVIEVLSEGTALMDRNEKLEEYIQIETLQEYVLISQAEAKVERYLRQESGDWLYTQATGLESSIALPSIECTLALTDVYNKVTLEADDKT